VNATAGTIERRTIAKISWRLLPLIALAYCVAYIDRTNVGFAALTMNKDLGFTATVYALGATAFFWGYCLFEIPSNIVLEKIGARVWIARIMITWGLFSAATAFVTGSTSFATIRFFLGVCEAGFFPGMILYFTYWFPGRYRGRVVGWFMTAIPIAIFLGGPISTSLLVELDGLLGLAGWRWLFICEAVPAVMLGFVVLFYLTDRPAKAHWLEPHEREWLIAELAAERSAIARNSSSCMRPISMRMRASIGKSSTRSGARRRKPPSSISMGTPITAASIGSGCGNSTNKTYSRATGRPTTLAAR